MMPGAAPGVDVALRTDPGRDPDKQINEDACGERVTPFGHLVVVCDGMGGHEGGREASSAALESVLRTFEIATAGTEPREVLRLAVARANDVVFELGIGKEASGRPGSTIVAVLVHEGGTEVAHVGDSRCYRVHQGQIVQVTKDHSVVQKLVDAGALTPAEAARHPDANRITRALGSKLGVEVDLLGAPLGHVAGDTFVLCSDGLSDLVEPEDILRIVTSAPPEQAAGQLVDLANARGGHDNVTVAVCRPRESAKARASSPRVAPTITATLTESAPAPPAPAAAAPSPAAARDDVPSAVPSRRRRTPVGVLIGVGLVLVGAAAGGYAVYLHEDGEHHRHRRVPEAFQSELAAEAGAAASASQAPPPAPTPAVDVDAEPLLPLAEPDAGSRTRRTRAGAEPE